MLLTCLLLVGLVGVKLSLVAFQWFLAVIGYFLNSYNSYKFPFLK